MSIFLLLMGLFVNAPLEDLANGNVTPAVAKAPWYFLGLQELLAYFHPVVSGVLVPTFVLVGAALIPYVDRRQHPHHASLAAEDSGRAVQPVLRLRARRHVRRHLLPGPGLQLRDPVRDHERAPLQSLIGFVTDRGFPSAMSNYHVEAVDQPKALTKEALKALRKEQVQGLSRRRLLRRSLGGGVALWLAEVSAGTLGFLWPNLVGGFGGKVLIGTFNDLKLQNCQPADRPGLPGLRAGRARLHRPHGHERRQEFTPGTDTDG